MGIGNSKSSQLNEESVQSTREITQTSSRFGGICVVVSPLEPRSQDSGGEEWIEK